MIALIGYIITIIISYMLMKWLSKNCSSFKQNIDLLDIVILFIPIFNIGFTFDRIISYSDEMSIHKMSLHQYLNIKIVKFFHL